MQSIIAKDAVSSFITSKNIERKIYKIIVVLPESYKTSNKNYPVVYILDGEYYSTYTAETNLLAQSQLTPECIIIGICTNNHQNRTFLQQIRNQDKFKTYIQEGADQFLEYIEKTSALSLRYRTQDYKSYHCIQQVDC